MWQIALFVSILAGQLGRIQITSSVAFYLHDLVIFGYILFHIKGLAQVEWKKIPFVKPLVVVGAVCSLSLLANISKFQLMDVGVSLLYLLRFFMYIAAFTFVLFSNKTQLYWFRFLYFLGVGYSVLGFMQLVLYPNLRNLAYLGWDPHYYRLFSTLFDPNYVGSIVVMCLFLGIYLYIETRTKYMIYISQLILIVALLFTYSRSSIIACIFGLIVYICMTKKLKYLIAFILIPFILSIFPSFGGISTDIGRMWSVSARIANWQESSNIFLNSPIIGYGFNTLRALPRKNLISPYGYIPNASGGVDNSVLFILVTTGLIGLVAFINLGIHLIRKGYSISKQSLRAVYLSILVVLMVHSTFVNTLFYPQILIWFWIFAGSVGEKGNIISRS